MPNRLPPLNSLRCFEAAARLESFSKPALFIVINRIDQEAGHLMVDITEPVRGGVRWITQHACVIY